MSPPRPQGFPNIAAQLLNTPLAIHPHKAEVLVCAMHQKLGIVSMDTIDGVTLEARELLARSELARKEALARDATYDSERRKSYRMSGDIAVIHVEGTLVHKAGWLDAMSGFCGYNLLARQFEDAFNDPDVTGIWVEVDSPGGAVAGLFSLVEDIAKGTQSEGGKPVFAWVNEQACSAAYAIASVCDRVYGPRDAVVGSMGCLIVHTSIAQALEDNGIAVTVIRAGERKARGNPYENLDEETSSKLLESCQDVRRRFARLVAMGRDITFDAAMSTEADWFEGQEAVDLGLLDEIVAEREAWARLEDECDRIKRERRQAR